MIDEKKLIDKETLLWEIAEELYYEDTRTPEDFIVRRAYKRIWEIIEAQPKISLENKTSDNDVPDNNAEKMNIEFEKLEVAYFPDELCPYPEYIGKPYFAIRYKENGNHFVGYGTYSPEVLSRYLKDYFMPLAMQGTKWIPCSKEQPPKPEDVTRQEYIVQAKGVIEPYIASWDGEKWFYDEFGGYEVEEGNILAWMPLPEAYKGE